MHNLYLWVTSLIARIVSIYDTITWLVAFHDIYVLLFFVIMTQLMEKLWMDMDSVGIFMGSTEKKQCLFESTKILISPINPAQNGWNTFLEIFR